MEGKFITVIAYLFGEQKKHLDGVVSIENPHDTTLRATIAKAIKQEKPQLPFSANNHIHRVTSPSGTNIGVMLDHPVIHAVKKIKGDEFVVIIDNGSSSTPIQEQTTGKAAASTMVAMNQTVMAFVVPKHSLETVHNFQYRFNTRSNSREKFLRANKNNPSYDDQIMSGIVTLMEKPYRG